MREMKIKQILINAFSFISNERGREYAVMEREGEEKDQNTIDVAYWEKYKNLMAQKISNLFRKERKRPASNERESENKRYKEAIRDSNNSQL